MDGKIRYVGKTLKATGNTARLAPELAREAHSLATRLLDGLDDAAETACEKGCSFCCHQPATAFAFEAIQIAQALKGSLSKAQLQALREKLAARADEFKNSSVRAQVNNKSPCPLLRDNQCSVYNDRPLTCRMAHSFSVKKCRLSFEKDRMKVQIPMSVDVMSAVSAVIEEAFEELPAHGLDGNLYELSSAVLAALGDPGAALRWASGDRRVFADCTWDDT